MPVRSLASLSLTFGLVSIPIKLYSATESTAGVRFKWMSPAGARVRQQFVADPPAAATPLPAPADPAPRQERAVAAVAGAASKLIDFPSTRRGLDRSPSEPEISLEPAVVERSTLMKGYEYQRGKFVLFTPDELKALEAGSRKTIDIVSFIPDDAIDPLFYDKAYFLAPDKRGGKPYELLLRAMRDTQRSALAKWAFRSKEYVAQIRAADGVMVLQQLLYADEVRSAADLAIEHAAVGEAELELAKQLIGQISADTYDPAAFVDEEKQRILAAVEEKIAGRAIHAPERVPPGGGRVVDLLGALRASLARPRAAADAGQGAGAPGRKPAKKAVRKTAGAGTRSHRNRAGRG